MKKTGFFTVSGRNVDVLNLQPSDVTLHDIAFSLGNICRYNGHVEFYSVAQHSVMASYIVPDQQKLPALFHDAAEAYLGDLTPPVKMELPNFRALEDRVLDTIFEKFQLPAMTAIVKHADLILRATEIRDLHGHFDYYLDTNCVDVPMLTDTISPWSPGVARQAFLDRANELFALRDATIAKVV